MGSFKLTCYLVVVIAVLLDLTLVPYVNSAPASVPRMMNATRKFPKMDSISTTTIAPIKLQAADASTVTQLSPVEDLLSIISNNNQTELYRPSNKDSLNEEFDNKTDIANARRPFKKAKNETTREFKQDQKQTSQPLKTQSLAPSNLKAKGTSAANSSRGEKGETSAVVPGNTPSSRNRAAPRKPQSTVDATFTAIPTNKTVGKHSNTSEAVTQRATLSDVMGFLQKFGYLEGRFDNRSEGIYTKETVVQAISDMQRFGGLPPTGVIDNATLELMMTPRCGNKDVESDEGSEAQSRRKKRFVIGAPGWNKRRLTYFLANWSPKIGSEETTLNELKRAFKVWSEYAHLKFVQAPTADADIVILFGHGYHGDRYPFDGPGFTLAHAYYPYEYAQLGGDVHFDEDEPWTVAPREGSSEIDFFTVATHELGHSLGLAHSSVPGSIMFPYYKGYQANLHLDYDDILAVYQLYISRHVHDDRESDGEVVETTTSTTEQPTPTLTTTLPVRTTTSSYGEVAQDDEDSEEEDVTPTTMRTINYHGDYETVDDHKRKQNASTSEEPPAIPDICQGYFDAVSVMRNELFFFKGQYVWRLRQRMVIDDGYPTHIRHLFRELPHTLTKVDAVYERPDGHIVFFSGDRYWVFNGDRMVEQNMPLAYLGLPDGLERLDAALVWAKNKKTYFFSKNLYWRYDDVKRQMDAGYPHDVSRWRGVPAGIDAAMQWTDGRTYFFKHELFWRFDDALVRIDGRFPLMAAPYWLACPEHE